MQYAARSPSLTEVQLDRGMEKRMKYCRNETDTVNQTEEICQKVKLHCSESTVANDRTLGLILSEKRYIPVGLEIVTILSQCHPTPHGK